MEINREERRRRWVNKFSAWRYRFIQTHGCEPDRLDAFLEGIDESRASILELTKKLEEAKHSIRDFETQLIVLKDKQLAQNIEATKSKGGHEKHQGKRFSKFR